MTFVAAPMLAAAVANQVWMLETGCFVTYKNRVRGMKAYRATLML